MLPRRLESLFEQPPKLLIHLGVDPTQHLNVLQRELERGSLKADVARRVREHEPEVDVDEVALAVEEDVAVVPIFDLEEVCYDGVACQNVRAARRVRDQDDANQLVTLQSCVVHAQILPTQDCRSSVEGYVSCTIHHETAPIHTFLK